MTRPWSASLVVLMMLSVPTVFAAEPGAGVRAQLADTPVLRGRFEQEKQLEGFRNPLRSSGGFLLARERGVIWDTQLPFASSVVLTRERMLQRQPDGRERVLLEAATSPAVLALNSLLIALIGGDLDALAQQFLVEEMPTSSGWRIELRPTDAALQRVLVRITLAGDRHVRSARIEERNGDRSEIRFLDLVDAPPTLTAAESARFD